MIYRVARAEEWHQARRAGRLEAADYVSGGFHHLAERHQVGGVLERHFAGAGDLWLLAVDEAAMTAPCRRENTTGGTEPFPHVYGPVPLGAVVAATPLVRCADGGIDWPPGW